MIRPSRLRARVAAFAAILAVPVALWAALPTSPSAAPDAGGLQGQIDRARSREHSLSTDAAALGALADQLAGDVAVLEKRQAEVQAELAAKRAELARTQDDLARERVRDSLANLKIESILPGGYLSFPEEYGYQAHYLFVVQQNMPDGSSPIIYPKIAQVQEGVAANPRCSATAARQH